MNLRDPGAAPPSYGQMRCLVLVLLASLCAAAPAAAQVTTFGDADGVVRLPEAIAVAPDGAVLVGDHSSGRVQRFVDGRPAGSFGFRGRTCGRVGAISGVAAAPDGRVYVLDADHSRVVVFRPDGTVQRCFGRRGLGRGELRLSSGTFAGSTASGGIAVSGTHVYVADAGGNRVVRWSLDGRDPKVLGKGRMRQPQGLAVRGSRLLVADDGNHRVVELTTTGRFVRASTLDLDFPYDVAIAPDGDAYVVDNSAHRIVVLDRRLRRKDAFGRQGRGAGQLTFPRAIALARDGDVVVADAANDRIAQFAAGGRWVRSFGTNGRATPRVSTPADVAVNAYGEVAVADANARISWFDLSGRYLGRWAQGRSFQTSSATVLAPRGLAFAGPDQRRLRVVDSGQVRELAAGEARDLLPGGRESPVIPADVEVDAAGTTYVLNGRGQVATLPSVRLVGTPLPRDRSSGALALLPDGSFAVTDGPTEQAVAPKDGTIRRLDRDGKLLSTWTIARPPRGEPSRPSGVASDGAGGVWVSDAANDRVLHLDATGATVAVLGALGRAPGQLVEPGGLVLDCAGGLVVADTGGSRVQRFAGVGPAPGCLSTERTTASAGPPRAIGVRVRTLRRARTPQARIGTFRVTCARTCRRSATATAFTLRGRTPRRYPLRARFDGSRLTVTAGPAAVRALRAAGRGGLASVGVEVRATSSDGVTDLAGASVRFG